MTEAGRREAARQFSQKWQGKGKEDEDARSYWIEILAHILGVEKVTDKIDFEKKVIVDGHTKRIDVYIPETRVLIEQKSLGIDLNKPAAQSGGIELTPYEQAKRYNDNLPVSERARWIVTSNFAFIHVYDMDTKVPEESLQVIDIQNLQTESYRLDFLVKKEAVNVSKELEISKDAGRLVGKIYDAFLTQYTDPENPETLHNLNALCVRLVFCLYAEDAAVFGKRSMFRDYIKRFEARDMRRALIDLFECLDTPEDKRNPYLDEDLSAFPYVNGGLFSNTGSSSIEIPRVSDEIRELLINDACDFDWARISPTIFGAVFESTLNPETRRAGGMHYTSVENIHKVIDPLFLDGLKEELEEIKHENVISKQKTRLKAFQKKLSELNFLDPACGSGNFLTESYICLRRLENEVLKLLIAADKKEIDGQIIFNLGDEAPIKVTIGQFYGIEINDFAVSVAQTALWIAESQMLKETEDVVHQKIEFLPLKAFTNIVEANALRIDWANVIAPERLDYIMGNPPFVGARLMSKNQKEDIEYIYFNGKGTGNIDYVAGWYRKTADFINNTAIECAFVSTNSITQGEQAPLVFRPLNIYINFAYRTFIWNSEATDKAAVHCVIIGFSANERECKLLFENDEASKVNYINSYLIDAPDIYIESCRKPICDVEPMVFGSMANDGGYLLLDEDERNKIIEESPEAEEFIKKFVGSREYINKINRYCLWLKDKNPSDYRKIDGIVSRIKAVKEQRENSNRSSTRALADVPYLFGEIRQPDKGYILVPRHSSEKRRYIPLGFMSPEIICGDANMLIPTESLYYFGIMTSNIHMAWMRTVCGRIKSDYRYSANIVYNNFPWPTPTDDQKSRIEQTAQGILDARNIYPDASLADLYDPLTMPPELQKAHTENDRAVMKAYGFDIKNMSETDCVAELMKMYQKLTA